nr:ribonuclease H-like domain-containing protein [Tanacetum cinerariifolium]
MVTRSQSGIVKPIKRLSLLTLSISLIPKSSFFTFNDPNWCNAMYDEYTALVKNSAWVFVPRPSDVNLVCSMWLFKHKFHADGILSRHKARLVANDSCQQLGVDFDETFSPVVNPATIRTKKYALQLIEHATMVHCNPSRTLVDTESKLGPDANLSLYARFQGATFCCSQMYHALCKGNAGFGLHSYASATTYLVGYIDADWAEYRGVANAIAKTTWVRNLLRELHSPLLTATLVYCDNVSTIYMSAKPVQHQWTKHIEIDIQFVRDMVTAGHVRVLHVPSRF